MSNTLAPIIIKKKKIIKGGGHHGGAWKVAYADFVTAMMAFFMLMWLLNATTEKQRKGIADYFNPNIPINRISGGGIGAFGGDSIFSENTLAKSKTGSSGTQAPWKNGKADSAGGNQKTSERLLEELNATLVGNGGESELMENALKHVISRISDEGVVIELFDLPNRPLFNAKNEPNPILDALIMRVSEVAEQAENHISIQAHARTEPIVTRNSDPWLKTVNKSLAVRRKLAASGIALQRFNRVTGKADTALFVNDPLAVRNNRIEVIFLINEN